MAETINQISWIEDTSGTSYETRGFYYIEGTGTTAGTWLGQHPGIKKYYDGLTIAYKIGIAGSSSGTTLNINNLGEATVYRNYSSKITTHYPVGSVVVLTYVTNGQYTGWHRCDYDSTDTYTIRPYYARYYTGSNPLYRYKICGVDAKGKIQPLTVTNQTSATIVTKTVNTVAIRPDEFYYYATTSTVAANTVVGHGYLYLSTASSYFTYTFNSVGTTYREIYLVGTYSKDTGLFTLDNSSTTSWYTLVPYNTDYNLNDYFVKGKQYILLGRTYSSANNFYLYPNHHMYSYNDSNLIEENIASAVKQKYSNANEYRPLLFSGEYTKDSSSGENVGDVLWNNSIYVNPYQSELTLNTVRAHSNTDILHLISDDEINITADGETWIQSPNISIGAGSNTNSIIIGREDSHGAQGALTLKGQEIAIKEGQSTITVGNDVISSNNTITFGTTSKPFNYYAKSIYAKESSTSSSYGTGSNGQVLTSNGSETYWSTLPSVPTKTSDLTNDSNFISSVDGKIPSSYLPAYVDDVVEYNNLSSFPTTGESGVIYITKDTNLTYRWSGTGYVEISPSIALGETASTAYAGNKGKANADAITTINQTLNGLSTIYAAKDHTHSEYALAGSLSSYLPLTGGTVTGDLTLYTSSTGASPRLTFQRGTLTDSYNDWSIYDIGGYLKVQQRGSGSTNWEDRLTLTQSGASFAGSISEGGTALSSKYAAKSHASADTTYGVGSTSNYGHLKVGSNLTVNNGTISLTKDNVTAALGFQPGSQYSLPLAANGTRGGIQIGYSESGANIPLKLSSEKGYVTLTRSAVNTAGLGEAYLSWGGKNFSAAYGPIDAAMIGELGANRLAYAKAAGITIEYSRDSGATWTDYGATDSAKLALTSVGTSLNIGKATLTDKATAAYMLRITFNTKDCQVYTALNKFAIYVSTNGTGGNYCTIRGRTRANVVSGADTWNTFVNQQAISGWSGWNIINTDSITTYGNTDGQYAQLQFIFGCTTGVSSTTNAAGLQILKLFGFGGVGWQTPSNLARLGTIYTADYGQNVVFPATVRATSFNEGGTLLSNKYQAKGSYASASHTHTTSDITNFPAINNATLKIQKNGSDIGTFTANSSTDTTVNITVPTKVSDLTNDNGFITQSNVSSSIISRVSSLPTASATSADLVEISQVLYRKQLTGTSTYSYVPANTQVVRLL